MQSKQSCSALSALFRLVPPILHLPFTADTSLPTFPLPAEDRRLQELLKSGPVYTVGCQSHEILQSGMFLPVSMHCVCLDVRAHKIFPKAHLIWADHLSDYAVTPDYAVNLVT